MFLPDINVWLALTFDSHLHHPQAAAWFDSVPDKSCLFCRMTQQGFLRLVTNPKAFPDDAVAMGKAWELYDSLLSDPRVVFSTEALDVETAWRGYTTSGQFSPKVWNDAWLAAFCRAADLEAVTFDRGFRKFADCQMTILGDA